MTYRSLCKENFKYIAFKNEQNLVLWSHQLRVEKEFNIRQYLY